MKYVHPNSIFRGAVEWWQHHADLLPEKPAFVQYAKTVLSNDPEWQRAQKLRQARQRLGMVS